MKQDYDKLQPETVLIFNGGGSLGAYECGVYKALIKHDLKFDIIGGTSIGAVNAAIVATAGAGSKEKDNRINSAKVLEHFWLSMLDETTPSFLPYDLRASMAAMYSLIYGNPKAFVPIWFTTGGLPLYNLFNSPYLYTTTKLENALTKYVDFAKLKRSNRSTSNSNSTKDDLASQGTITGNNSIIPRLILACTDIRTAQSVIFDTNKVDITADDLSACTAYPFYGIEWKKINSRYLWDGSLLTNTPIRDVIDASPKGEKRIYISDIFPRKQEKLPQNMIETWHRARDIVFLDKATNRVMENSNLIKNYIAILEEMYDILGNSKLDEKAKRRVKMLEPKYNDLINNRGGIIDKLVIIRRKESPGRHHIFEDADFSSESIKELIKQGEEDAKNAIANQS